MSEEETKKNEEVKEQQMEMFLIDDFESVKKLLRYTSFPSNVFLYQMPNKATSYVDSTPESSANLMNTLLEYQRTEDWRVELCKHYSDWVFDKVGEVEKLGISVVSNKTNKQYNLSFTDIKEAIVVPDLHCITIVPSDNVEGDILPNMIIRFVGLVQQRFFKCIMEGEDDKENEGKRLLNMRFEPLED